MWSLFLLIFVRKGIKPKLAIINVKIKEIGVFSTIKHYADIKKNKVYE
jgi:hypothetical protein